MQPCYRLVEAGSQALDVELYPAEPLGLQAAHYDTQVVRGQPMNTAHHQHRITVILQRLRPANQKQWNHGYC